jgi:flavin-dependent dehydrogenase
VILGGGPAGCATALALRRHGISGVLLVEVGEYGTVRVGESIPPETRLLLERLGLWRDFLSEGHEPCLGSCSIWGAGEPGYNDFLFNPHGNGWHLDRRRFDSFLARKAAEAGVEVREHTRFTGVEPLGREGFALRLTSGGEERKVIARYVIDATGGAAKLARALGAKRRFHDRLSCVAAFLELPPSAALSRLTLLEAVEYGWWYAARLPENRVAVAVASDPEIVRAEALHRSDVWQARLRETRLLWGELAGCGPPGDGLTRSAALSFRLDRACGPGWLAVGDAASSYDPISSQGIYKALLDGLEAAEAVATSPAGYQAALDARFEDYLVNRNYFYGLERRWPAAPFWARRRSRAGVSPSWKPPSH